MSQCMQFECPNTALDDVKNPALCSAHRKHIWKTYRLTDFAWARLYWHQIGKCHVCMLPGKKLYVDHKHGCNHVGKGRKSCADCVRGLLCHDCNLMMGFSRDDPQTLANGMNYLGFDPREF